MMNRVTLILSFLILIIITACASPATPPPVPTPGGELTAGVLASFAVKGETFNIWVTDSRLIDQLTQPGVKDIYPIGPILPGSGLGDHNSPWNWHFSESDLKLVSSVEPECDVPPSEVEDNLIYFIEVLGKYCPNAKLLVTTQYP